MMDAQVKQASFYLNHGEVFKSKPGWLGVKACRISKEVNQFEIGAYPTGTMVVPPETLARRVQLGWCK